MHTTCTVHASSRDSAGEEEARDDDGGGGGVEEEGHGGGARGVGRGEREMSGKSVVKGSGSCRKSGVGASHGMPYSVAHTPDIVCFPPLSISFAGALCNIPDSFPKEPCYMICRVTHTQTHICIYIGLCTYTYVHARACTQVLQSNAKRKKKKEKLGRKSMEHMGTDEHTHTHTRAHSQTRAHT